MAEKNRPNEIYLTRIFDAPVKLVWDAWTDPKKAAEWWGPRGFTITTHSKEFKPGGIWHYTMHGPDGVDYPNKAKYLEIEPLSRMVYDHGGYDDRPALFRVTVTFAETKGKTKMEMTMALATPEAAAEAKKFIKKASGNSTWDRFAEYLAEKVGGKDQFVINRSFDIPIEQMYQLWVSPEHLPNWLPPTGFNMKFFRSEIKEGATTFFSMSNGSVTLFARSKYLELNPPHRIVHTQQFCDEKENISRHPMAPTWPETMLNTIVFADEGDGNTRVTVTSEIYGEATAEERAAFHEAKSGMTAGWTGSFDKLESLK